MKKSNAEHQRAHRERIKHRDDATKCALKAIIKLAEGKNSETANAIRSAAEDVLKLFK